MEHIVLSIKRSLIEILQPTWYFLVEDVLNVDEI